MNSPIARRACLTALILAMTAAGGVARAEGDLFHTLQRNSWYLPAHDMSAALFVTSLGRGPKVVVLHGGFGANFEYMVGAIERHTKQREFVLFDQRGSLLSPYRGKLEELSVDDLVDDLEKLRKELGGDKLTLLGHSMGTVLAYEYLRRYPDNVAALILTGAFPPAMTAQESGSAWDPINARAEALSERSEVRALMAREGVDKVTKDSPARELTSNWRIRFASANLARIEKWRDMEGGRAYYKGDIGGQLSDTFKPYDIAALLGERRIPITVIQGDQDYVDPAATGWTAFQRADAPLASCVRVHVLERVGHGLWVDDPDKFETALNDALLRDASCPDAEARP